MTNDPHLLSLRTASPQITLTHVGKTFSNNVTALRNLNLQVRKGEFIALLGASGCGKSTALRIIAGLSQPTIGTVDLHDLADKKNDIGFVFQEPTLMPWATVYDNVYLPLRLKKIAKGQANERIMNALATVGLTDFAKVYPRQLSGGMKMRCSIARAMVTEPSLVLMDEPFAALDELTRQRLNDEFLSLWQRFGWTVVFVTHSVSEATYLSSRTLVLSTHTGGVMDEMFVDVPYPRHRTLRTNMQFQSIVQELSSALLRASEGL